MTSGGYISEVDYVYGYYEETSPDRLKLALLACGVDHSVKDDFTYLELGFGQGLSLSINAASSNGQFYGTDFNPAQVANALEFASSTGKDIRIYEDSFVDLAKRDELPQFDIIVLHGIWSWISDSDRQAIIDIAQNRLKPGGIFYISYNVTPGWSPAMPIRHLMAEYSKRAAKGGILNRAQESIAYVQGVIDAGALYFAMHPQLKERIDHIRTQNAHYVAHEYFNADWEPMPFSKVADILSDAKLTYAGSANIIDNVPALSTPDSAHEILAAVADPVLRETTLDYFVNRQFRRDIFVKGVRRLDDYQRRAMVSRQRFVLCTEKNYPPEKISTAFGEAELKQAIYAPVMAALAEALNQSCSVEDIARTPDCRELNFWDIWEALLILVGSGLVAPANIDGLAERQVRTNALNGYICSKAEAGRGINYLASPLTGAAAPISWLDQLFLKKTAEGVDNVPLAVWNSLEEQGKHLVIEGEEIADATRNVAELTRLHSEFLATRIPLLKRLSILE